MMTLQSALQTLEYEKVIARLSRHAVSEPGKKLVKLLRPETDLRKARERLDETDEAATVFRLKNSVPLGGIHEIRPFLQRAALGVPLNPQELRDIAETIAASARLRTFLTKFAEENVSLPRFMRIISEMTPVRAVEKEIERCIDENGVVVDEASPQLKAARRRIKVNEETIRRRLGEMLRSRHYAKYLSESILTVRNDRYVLPVKQEHRSRFGGFVHDQSSSGQTLFVEPAAVVDLNNELQAARVEEKKETEKILKELTFKVAEHRQTLEKMVEAAARCDFIFARASFARELEAVHPHLNEDGTIVLKKARHPLIPSDRVVPIDIRFGGEKRALVITGPNTGGKTVALKTIGLLTCMAQSGLYVPAAEGAKVAFFRRVFADIGDEQSIEQNLSTFSSHMTNIVRILQQTDEGSLLLFDEIGSGTDPEEGAALAVAILDYVREKGATVAATTHYSELKAYAYEREGVLNASVEFDVQTLRPTYRLVIGVPGRSNAFEISARLGLPEAIIQRARQQLSQEANKVDRMISSLEEKEKRARRLLQEAKQEREEARSLKEKWEHKIAELENERRKILQDTAQKATEQWRKAKRKVDELISELRQMQKEGAQVKEHRLIEAKKQFEESLPDFTENERQNKQNTRAAKKRPFAPGDKVKVLRFGQKGEVVEKKR